MRAPNHERSLSVLSYVLLLVLSFTPLISGNGGVLKEITGPSPYEQNLPKCSDGFVRVEKKTDAKALLCPMFRDEEGFLSEWVAYYKMQGFDHIIMFNDSSTDNALAELQPFIDIGFVSIRQNWTSESLNISPNFLRNEFKKAMTTKAALERECKQQGLAWGYKYFMSLDIDEYVPPFLPLYIPSFSPIIACHATT
jgi:hypothetical protein